MRVRRWSLGLAVASVLTLATGCMSDDVVYVDGNGRQLAVDAEGRPVLPEAAPRVGPQVGPQTGPAVAARPAPPPTLIDVPTPVTRPAAAAVAVAKPGTPAPDPAWDLPSAQASQPGVAPAAAEGAAPARKVGTSSDLDLPPAG